MTQPRKPLSTRYLRDATAVSVIQHCCQHLFLQQVPDMPGCLEFCAGVEMFSENWLDVSLTNQTFLFYLYHGKKKAIKFFEAKRACVSTVLIELHTDCNNYFEEFEPLTSTLSLPAFLGWVSVQIIIFESIVTFFFFVQVISAGITTNFLCSIPNYLNAFMAVRSLPSCQSSDALLVSFIFVLSVSEFLVICIFRVIIKSSLSAIYC